MAVLFQVEGVFWSSKSTNARLLFLAEGIYPAYASELFAPDEPGKANGRGEEPAIAAAYVASGVP
ncbi:MAG: hypothetical protein V3V61_02605 [Gammaproteobacteria bacterium]